MAKTITMYKDGRSRSNIYPSEVSAWAKAGWSTSPIAEPTAPAVKPVTPKKTTRKRTAKATDE